MRYDRDFKQEPNNTPYQFHKNFFPRPLSFEEENDIFQKQAILGEPIVIIRPSLSLPDSLAIIVWDGQGNVSKEPIKLALKLIDLTKTASTIPQFMYVHGMKSFFQSIFQQFRSNPRYQPFFEKLKECHAFDIYDTNEITFTQLITLLGEMGFKFAKGPEILPHQGKINPIDWAVFNTVSRNLVDCELYGLEYDNPEEATGEPTRLYYINPGHHVNHPQRLTSVPYKTFMSKTAHAQQLMQEQFQILQLQLDAMLGRDEGTAIQQTFPFFHREFDAFCTANPQYQELPLKPQLQLFVASFADGSPQFNTLINNFLDYQQKTQVLPQNNVSDQLQPSVEIPQQQVAIISNNNLPDQPPQPSVEVLQRQVSSLQKEVGALQQQVGELQKQLTQVLEIIQHQTLVVPQQQPQNSLSEEGIIRVAESLGSSSTSSSESSGAFFQKKRTRETATESTPEAKRPRVTPPKSQEEDQNHSFT